ncbi:hypothetical protein EDD85DRAFT_794036 [Armillaria nabsnona]|nr:hypothetical protein EDD85DRAFT_794036 [Armillaria nabsnona]
MWSTTDIVLFSVFIGVSSALFGAACVLAIQFHLKNPTTYINQYNINPTVNYVLPQQPPIARVHSPIHNHRSTEIHELHHLHSQFHLVERSKQRRPTTPYSISAASHSIRDIPAVFNPDNLWDTITPSAFLSVSAFIPPRERTPEIHVKDAEYLSILNLDQPVPGSQSEQIPFDESSTPELYSQEPTLEPIARPS